MEPESKPMTTKELTEAVTRLLEREERLQAQQQRRRRRRVRERRRELEATQAKLIQSVEVIKWCIVGIVTVMTLSFVAMIVVAFEVEKEVSKVKEEAEKIMVQVREIQSEAERIRSKIRHPLEALGSSLGRRLEGEIGNLMGGRDE